MKLAKWLSLVLLTVFFVPSLAHAQAPQQHGMTLTWSETQGTDPATGFFVYRSTVTGGPYARLFSIALPLATTTYFDSTGIGGTKYFYVVTAVDSLGDESANSTEISGTAISSNPAVPVNLSGVER